MQISEFCHGLFNVRRKGSGSKGKEARSENREVRSQESEARGKNREAGIMSIDEQSAVFRPAQRELSAMSCDGLFHDLALFLTEGKDGREAIIDLGEVEFIDPYGLGVICLIGRYIRGKFQRATYRLPQDGRLRSYLQRMQFTEAIDDSTALEAGHSYGESDTLLEITKVEQRGDVDRLLERINVRVEQILTMELRYTVREITQFKSVISELCHNILDHSVNWGYACAQRYMDRKRGKKFATIGVVDLGIGIRASLSARFDTSKWTHGRAILNAVKKDVSREPERGLGLYVVRRICEDYDGSLQIRSGDTRVTFRGKRVMEYRSAFFPGTQVGIVLYGKE